MTTTERAPESMQSDETAEGDTATTSEPDEAPKANREARFRQERNEAREALAAAEARIEKLQRAEVDRLAADLSQPGDLMEMGGVTLTDLLDAAGDVDSAAVAQAVAALIESRPGLAKNLRDRPVDMSQGHGNDRPARAEPTFATLLKS